MKYCTRGAILSNERIAESFYIMKIEAGRMAAECVPGQFVHMRSLAAGWPFLRRPFSVYSTDGEGNIEIIYKVVGKATSMMADAVTGDIVDVMGPLGQGFSLRRGVSQVVAVGGGVGIPPLLFFCQRYGGVLDRIDLLAGARTAGGITVPVSLLVEGVRITYYTEDGSRGEKGLVTAGLGPALRGLGRGSAAVIACGPRGMLAGVARVAAERGLGCQVSVEEIMACGVGACLSCAIPRAAGGYFHACKDGPVFDSETIDWERWTGE
jgi:dihydroorotate dehydrogenase electron transfer subunit